MGQISVLESQTYTWALENGCMLVQKEKEAIKVRGWEKWPKTRASQPASRRKTPRVKMTYSGMNTMRNPPSGDQSLAFQTHALQMMLFGPFYVRTQHCYHSLRRVPLQLLLLLLYYK